jgi:hypothetical protein
MRIKSGLSRFLAVLRLPIRRDGRLRAVVLYGSNVD